MREHYPFRNQESRDIIWHAYDESLERLPGAEERDVPTAYGRTHVVSCGPETGEPLFLVHGASANAAVLADLIANYAREGYRVHAPDIPGHGGRSEPRQLSVKGLELGKWLADVMESLGCKRAAVIGYSLGGLVALQLGIHASHRITRAVAAVPAGLSRPTVLRLVPMMFFLLLHLVTKSLRWRRRAVTAFVAKDSIPDESLMDWMELLMTHVESFRQPIPVLPASELGKVKAPFLVAAGAEDPCFDAQATVAAARALPHGAAEIMTHCGHVFDTASRERLHARTVEFLRST